MLVKLSQLWSNLITLGQTRFKLVLFCTGHYTDVILGIKIRKTKNGYSLCQSHYIEKLLEILNCLDVVPVRTPFNPSMSLKKNNVLVFHKLSMLKS